MKSSKLRELIYSVPLNTFKLFIGKELAIGFIEGILRKVNPVDVLYMIENDKYNLFIINDETRSIGDKARRILKANEHVVRKIITVDNVLGIIREVRPDIYSLIINHPKGLEWVKNTVKESLEYLLS